MGVRGKKKPNKRLVKKYRKILDKLVEDDFKDQLAKPIIDKQPIVWLPSGLIIQL